MSKVGKWSVSAGSNSSTVPDGWPEGMAPSGVNDAAREMMAQIKTYCNDAEWFDRDFTPSYVNANSFTVPGDQTTILHAGRALKLYDGTTVYRHVASASYTVVTTVSLDSGTAITSSLTSFAVATLAAQPPSQPMLPVLNVQLSSNAVVAPFAGPVVLPWPSSGTGVAANTYGWYSSTTRRYTPQWAGYYFIRAQVMLDTATVPSAGPAMRLTIHKNVSASVSAAVTLWGPRVILPSSANPIIDCEATGIIQMNGSSDFLMVGFTQTADNSISVYAASSLQAFYLGK